MVPDLTPGVRFGRKFGSVNDNEGNRPRTTVGDRQLSGKLVGLPSERWARCASSHDLGGIDLVAADWQQLGDRRQDAGVDELADRSWLLRVANIELEPGLIEIAIVRSLRRERLEPRPCDA